MTDDEYGELDEASIFRALADHDVEFVVVGGGAAPSPWRTDAGSLDVLAAIPDLDGVDVGYAHLRERATLVSAGEFGAPIASLDDIIQSKQHADRAKDREALPELLELRRRVQGETDQ